MDLALNNLQRLICHKTLTTNQPSLTTILQARTLTIMSQKLPNKFKFWIRLITTAGLEPYVLMPFE